MGNGNAEDSFAPVIFNEEVASSSAPAAHLDQGRICPWHFEVPQKIIGAISCPEGEITDFWFGGQPKVAHDMGKREAQHYSQPIY